MKTIAAFLLATAALEAAVVSSGYPLDPATTFAILFAAGLAGGFVADYSRGGRNHPAPVRRSATRPVPVRRPAPAEVFPSAIIFNTRVA